MPNDRYLASKLWELLETSDKEKVLKESLRWKPNSLAERIRTLCFGHGENPYWSNTDVSRAPFVAPVVSVKDYQGHSWQGAFNPTEEDTRREALQQLETLAQFKEYYLANHSGYWGGDKLFRFADPNNYLEIRPIAPYAVLLRPDQDQAFSREVRQREVSGSTLFGDGGIDIWEDLKELDRLEREGPGCLPPINWLLQPEQPVSEHSSISNPFDQSKKSDSIPDHSKKSDAVPRESNIYSEETFTLGRATRIHTISASINNTTTSGTSQSFRTNIRIRESFRAIL